MKLTPRQIFLHQSVAALAVVAEAAEAKAPAPEQAEGSQIPFTPIQHWFMARALPHADRFNQAVLLVAPPGLDLPVLTRMAKVLAQAHQALRLRLRDGGQILGPVEGAITVAVEDVQAVPDDALADAITVLSDYHHDRLSLTEGPVARLVLFDRGPSRSGRLLAVIHHMAVDGVSWRILIDDMLAVWRGQPLAPVPVAFAEWAARLDRGTDRSLAERDYWLGELADGSGLAVDGPGGTNLVADARAVTLEFDRPWTQSLMTEALKPYNTHVDEMLLAAVAMAFGPAGVVVDLEGHGRGLDEDCDLSRTVGWLTVMHPVRLGADADDPGRALTSTKEKLRRVPGVGAGYGRLRYLHRDLGLRAAPVPLVSFNYLGQFAVGGTDETPFSYAREGIGMPLHPDQPRAHLLEIGAVVAVGRLSVVWRYGPAQLDPAKIEAMAARFRASLESIVAHCLAPQAGAYTPSDFTDADLDQDGLDGLLAEIGFAEV